MIFKRTLHSKFTAISNAICLDESISTDARWCIWYLLTKPVDWQVRINDIRRVSGWGKDKTYKIVNELVAARYLVVSQQRGDAGRFECIVYDVYDEPFTGSPLPEKPETENPVSENKEHTKDLEVPSTEKIQNTEEYISVDAGFDEFWAAYPKRTPHPNPKKPAKLKYAAIRKQNVSHETIVNAARKYAKMRENQDPMYTAQAVTWLKQWRFEDDYQVDGGIPSQQFAATDEDLNRLEKVYPGHIGDREKARKLLAAEMAKGVSINEICLTAQKYSLFCKGPPYENRRVTPSMLEPWLQFKWREMDAYEFCYAGADRIKTVRPVKVGK